MQARKRKNKYVEKCIEKKQSVAESNKSSLIRDQKEVL